MAKKCYKILDFLHENFPPLSIIPQTNLPPPFRIPKADSSPEYLPPPLGRAGVGIPPLPWGGLGWVAGFIISKGPASNAWSFPDSAPSPIL